ncbi:unnamed protein product [Microthlaspi erraticum]|uniref:S5 DRBM domain-containing protein n=1 Tax=Microthlaspi erraticum TaxID=1685480 RepID=A0A6D2JG58_9BRAS|nr:unnamed protein product [Microthlaspi erraticum]
MKTTDNEKAKLELKLSSAEAEQKRLQNKQGNVAIGCAKAKEVVGAVQKFAIDVRGNIFQVPMTKYLTFPHRYSKEIPDAYEWLLLLDAIEGERRLFIRSDEQLGHSSLHCLKRLRRRREPLSTILIGSRGTIICGNKFIILVHFVLCCILS